MGSSREYTSLKDAVAEAIKYPYSAVYLDGETFDLVEEFGGQSALDSWTPDPEYVMYGIFLGNGITIKGTPYTKMIIKGRTIRFSNGSPRLILMLISDSGLPSIR